MTKDNNENNKDECQNNINEVIIHGEDSVAKEGIEKQNDPKYPSNHQQHQDEKENTISASTGQTHICTTTTSKTYSKREISLISCIVVVYVFVCSLSNRSYYPALPLISKEFNVSVAVVNMTMTVYMAFQGVSPCFWGPISDLWGRRPVYLASFIMFIGACCGLANVPSFSGLLALRMLQAFSESSSVAIGFGTICDVVAPGQRARFNTLIGATINTSTAISPIIGGVIAYSLSWRWIFWFLFIIGGVSWITILFLLPETLRSRTELGESSYNPPIVHWVKKMKLLLNRQHSHPPSSSTITNINSSNKKRPTHYSIPNFLEQILFLRFPDISLTIISLHCFSSVCSSLLLTTTPTHFSTIYNMNTLQIGLCFIPFASGCMVGSFFSGRILDRAFKNTALNNNMSIEAITSSRNLPIDFPIFRARLHKMVLIIISGQLVMIFYGWTLYFRTHLAVPLVFQFLVGVTNTPMFVAGHTLLIDLMPHRSASIMAVDNLVGGLIRALVSGTVEICIGQVDLGWTFTIYGLGMSVSTAIIPVLLKYGPKWRAHRIEEGKT